MLNVKKLFYKILEEIIIKHETYTTSNLGHLSSCSVSAYRMGRVGILQVTATNTSTNLAVGGDASCNIDMPRLQSVFKGIGYSGSSTIIASIGSTATNTSMNLRVTASTWAANYNVAVSIPVIFA